MCLIKDVPPAFEQLTNASLVFGSSFFIQIVAQLAVTEDASVAIAAEFAIMKVAMMDDYMVAEIDAVYEKTCFR